eukprot:Gregarina_sp_Pseudo_9__1065@NODE_1691_length_1395_cov_76_536873_g1567_i0_p1_GENE_NODE_1691_length_1395_cov_76_536873_g1567_i0NODE_1691_length_1395_cov_76_536873_g1567_i0_p1_ORF_typecomplete_len333_score51_89Hydrolase_3/PF08282_12/9_4e36S6PP/PF05116_13/1_6S6PP/PF05116_13/2_8e07PGP_phosphatase/PF09419_10/0_0099PGP_phosphatase/PF09419_10/3_5e02HAD/PF12710_7/9_3e02HAD/PF12710_7/3_5e03HAD/PF12710_7/0_028HAD_2/PF13419_6/1_4e02HAD_2/PF13419_6/0_72Trehalose_PPase/PF02358_16/49Trehalose_PPase/PF02358_16/
MVELPIIPGIKVVFTDLDNTLWIPQARSVPRRNLAALRLLQSKGIIVVPVTGRSVHASHRAVTRNGLSELNLYPGVYCDGAVVYDTDKSILSSSFLDHDVVAKVRDYMETSTRDGMLGYFCHNAFKTTDLAKAVDLYAYPARKRERFQIQESSHNLREISAKKRRLLEALGAESSKSSEDTSTEPGLVGTPRTPWDDDIQQLPENLENEKVVYFYIDGREHELIAEDIKDLIGTKGFDYCHQNPKYTVVRNSNCDKFAGLQKLMKHFGWKEEECLIVGDGDNDVCMLRGFPNSVVMKDGYESALEAAKFKSCLAAPEGGWGHVVTKMLGLEA